MNELALTGGVLVDGERSPQEWADYCREGERESVHATIEWCRRVFEAKQNLEITFRDWADSYYTAYSFQTLNQLAKVGKKVDWLYGITRQRKVANDWYTLYLMTTVESQIEQIPGDLDQKAIRQFKTANNRAHKINAIQLTADSQFPVIYADPPWRYEHVKTESRAIENQYPTMDLDDICALPVADIAQDDCILFLWATSPKLYESMKVLDAWGFEYRTCAVWDKEIIGMGYYFRQQHELLLVATRGEIPTPETHARPGSIFVERRSKHSSKPEIAYQIIETMYPDFAKVELFARNQREGWAAWGNQAT
jgi:N6-adenosine-specific RNA methylase IME4